MASLGEFHNIPSRWLNHGLEVSVATWCASSGSLAYLYQQPVMIFESWTTFNWRTSPYHSGTGEWSHTSMKKGGTRTCLVYCLTLLSQSIFLKFFEFTLLVYWYKIFFSISSILSFFFIRLYDLSSFLKHFHVQFSKTTCIPNLSILLKIICHVYCDYFT